MENASFIGTPEFEQGLTDLVTSDTPAIRTYGRLLATTVPEDMQAWVQSEQERGTDPYDLLLGLLLFSVQVFGSVAGQIYTADADPHLIRLWNDMAKAIPEIADGARKAKGLDKETSNDG